ncbi:MAG: thioredoxin domain-containing protein [Bacteroidales bacterium]|nr:thioredoxin domain-containing protein [Bacteroidales bacterium]
MHESSPYLLQHAHNPVNWYPWGAKALEKAREEKKLIIISIGYAACHWCHVMEHESFEDEAIARFMNEHFVSVKVDREERPDIDQVYMNAVQLIEGRVGWPLNCIALPDGRPIYGGTYFPKDQWLHMLSQVLTFVKEHPDKTEQQARALTEGLQSSDLISLNIEKAEVSIGDLDQVFSAWESSLDDVHGGHKGAPKFPLPVGFQYLLQYHYLTGNADALRAVQLTLNKMADGGIYDQIGGGFARYAVDAFWKVPHFEKMLYDNAQLVSLYSSAYQHTRDVNYKIVVSQTLDFIQRELSSDEGGFYSSLDADSEGEEGKYYVWTKDELQQILGDMADLIIEYYRVEEKGNWEHGRNILFKSGNDKQTAFKYNITETDLLRQVSLAKKILLKERMKRIPPGLDDKIITAWNALMLKACLDAYHAFDNSKYLDMALQNARFIQEKLKAPDHRLNRNYKNGKASINAFLDDYAFTIAALISLYQTTLDEKWIEDAQLLTDYAIDHFYDPASGMFFYTSDVDPALIARKMEVTDNVIPASNSEMAKNLFILGTYFNNNDHIYLARQMLNNVKAGTSTGGAYYANWDILMAWFTSPPYEVAILGDEYKTIRKAFNKKYLPDVFFSGGKSEGKLSLLHGKLIQGQTTIYVCRDKVCKLPVNEVKDALNQMYESK